MSPNEPHPLELLEQTLAAFESTRAEPVVEASGKSRPIDVIAIKKSAGYVFLTPSEWSATPTEERMSAIKERRAIFLSDEEPVSVRSALEWLKEHPDGLTP